MNLLPIKKKLKVENQLGLLGFVEGKEYAMYKGTGNESEIYYLTNKNNPKEIYMTVTKELWHEIFITVFEKANSDESESQ